jgi:hypothetical protein
MHGVYPEQRFQMRGGPGRRQFGGLVFGPEDKTERWFRSWSQASEQADTTARKTEGEALRYDWRPLFSYVQNLERIADQLLGTDAAWVSIGKAIEKPRAALEAAFGPFDAPRHDQVSNERRWADQMVLQYPWIWSAGILAGLVGMSTRQNHRSAPALGESPARRRRAAGPQWSRQDYPDPHSSGPHQH